MASIFENFIQRLEKRLSSPLPGKLAQQKMAPTPRGASRIFDWGKEKPRLGGVLILFYPNDGNIYFPLMQRPHYGGIHSGQISLPGGKEENHDQSLVETALREAEEEVGIISKEVKVIGTLTELYIIASNYHVLPVIGFVDQKPQFIPDQTEVVKILEANLTDLTSQSLKSKEMIVGNNITIESPYYDIHGHIVWGATAMMLSELVDIVRPIQ